MWKADFIHIEDHLMPHHEDRDGDQFDSQGNTRPPGDNYIASDKSEDGIDRRGFLRCMAWAGTATVWGIAGGVPQSFALSQMKVLTDAQKKSIFFAQISDSHIGFDMAANNEVAGTLR